jgi:predicted SPOUT superfamily RNA methylase MTH1
VLNASLFMTLHLPHTHYFYTTWKGEMRTGFWWENQKERDNLKDLGLDEKIQNQEQKTPKV